VRVGDKERTLGSGRRESREKQEEGEFLYASRLHLKKFYLTCKPLSSKNYTAE